MSFIDSFFNFLINSFSTAGFTDNFHFIRPWWLLAFFALGLILHLLKKMHYYQSPWQHFLPAHLTKVLLENVDNSADKHTTKKTHAPSQLKPLIIGFCLIFALAGPAWQQLPQPVYQLDRGSVLIMDMSYSMYATDIKPNRLTRSRYKAVDLLEKINEGDMGLIAYAGDAFIISPLTQDIRNIELLLPSLSPDIMPELGSNALAALMLANETLKNSGRLHGDIYWFTDDVDNEDMADIYDWSAEFGHNLHILGVGTQTGAPIKLKTGELLKDNSGAIVMPKLPSARLAALAQRGGGNYSTITNDDSDINYLTEHLGKHLTDGLNENSTLASQRKSDQKQQIQGDQYQEEGPWLLLIIIPLLLSYFRRGSAILSVSLLMPLSLLFSLGTFSTPTYANDSLVQTNENPKQVAPQINNQDQLTHSKQSQQSQQSGFWQDLWQTKDQQAQQNFEQENYTQAAEQFNNKQWQGSAHYKAGNFQQALDAFKQSDSGNALYNQGNSHAQMQQYDEAIEAYKKALIKDPNLKDAQDNIKKIEELKKQEEQDSQEGDQSEDSDEKNQDSQQDSKQDSKQDKQSQEGEQSENSDEKQQEDGESQDQSGQQQDESSSEEEKEQQEQSQQSDEQAEEEKKKQEQAAQQKEGKEGEDGKKTAAQIASEQKAQEESQKHQQLLNKVTDDPYLLLRNKMRLEYQNRQQEGNRQGVSKKW